MSISRDIRLLASLTSAAEGFGLVKQEHVVLMGDQGAAEGNAPPDWTDPGL